MGQKLALAVCNKCERKIDLDPKVVRGVVDSHAGRRINFYCPFCYYKGSVFLTWEQVKKRYRQAKKFFDESRAREIGVLVKGFAVDLEAVETVEDIRMFWIYQGLVRPHTIPREVVT